MTRPFRAPEDYELFQYTLSESYPQIQSSTLTLVRQGANRARVGPWSVVRPMVKRRRCAGILPALGAQRMVSSKP